MGDMCEAIPTKRPDTDDRSWQTSRTVTPNVSSYEDKDNLLIIENNEICFRFADTTT